MMYLKDNIQFAPYIQDWYAWSHLLPPHTAAANIAERHIKIMESFIDCPELHMEAIHTHGMLGGPFINLHPQYQSRIADLLERTKESSRHLLQFNHDLKQFSYALEKNTHGMSLENWYTAIPASLKGLVELTYNLHNKPQLRFIEPLIYSTYYQDKDQTLCLRENLHDNRPFSFSTPYTPSDDSLSLSIPFSSSLIDELAKMKYQPGNPDAIFESLNLPNSKRALFNSFFIENKRLSPPTTVSNGIRVKYMGHACVLLESPSVNILIDPAFGYHGNIINNDRYTAHDLPDQIDYVLITHNHQDHFLLETLLQLRHKIKNIVVPSSNQGELADPSLKLILKQIGFHNILTLDELDTIELTDNNRIMALPFFGEHADLSIHSKCSYYISLSEKRFLFMADSNNLDNDLYHHLFKLIGRVDIIFIGMECVGAPASWLYGPLFPQPLQREHDQSRRLSGSDAKKAWEIVNIFDPKEVYVYAMGMEPWLVYIMAIDYDETSKAMIESTKFVSLCRENGIVSERLFGKRQWEYGNAIP